MKRSIITWQLAGFAAVSLFGTLLHFLYDWTGSTFVALFSAVNESTWEHMKLIFFPMLAFAIVQRIFIGGNYPNFWCIKLAGTLIGLVTIPVVFYTLRGIFGTTPDWINIAIFFVAVALAFLYEKRAFKKADNEFIPPTSRFPLAFAGLCLIGVLFFVFTFAPPEIPLFQDPIDGSFGI